MSGHTSASVRSEPPRAASSRALLIAAIGAWLLANIGRAVVAASQSSGDGARQAGAFVGALIATLLIVFVGRCVVRLVRRQPILSPLWTPSLFFCAAGLSVLLLAAAAGQESS